MRAAPAFSQNYLYVIDQVKTDENPMRRNQGTTALDIATGKVIWKLHIGPGGESSSITGVADGYLATYGGYTSERYILGKGPSKITVSAPQTSVQKGQSVVITGTITDQSPALKDTPCIADVSMAEWMAYKFLQHPYPTNATGVPVTLTATDPDGSTTTIVDGLISDTSGNFGYKWTPPAEGLWAITAVFKGTDSYGSSFDTTYAGVDVAPSPHPVITPTPTVAPTAPPTATPSPSQAPAPTEAPNTAVYIGIAAVIVLAVIATIAVILRRRK